MAFLAAAGLVMVIFGLAAYYATDELSTFSIANLVLGPLLLLMAGVVQGRRITGFRGALSRRVALRWTGILAVVGTAVVLVNGAVSDWGAVVDLTSIGSDEEAICTLSPQTLETLREIDEGPGDPIVLLLFLDTPLADAARPLVRCYRAASAGLTLREIRLYEAPPEALPELAYEPALLVCGGSRCEPVGYPGERNLTTALIRLLGRGEVRAYFLLGHGEIDVADESEGGFSGVRDVLRAEGVEPRGWIGPARESAPEDADLVIVASPERDLLDPELDALERYLARGGRLLVLLEPGNKTNLTGLLGRWGFGLPDGVVADRASSPLLEEPRAVNLLVNSFSADHPLTRRFSRRTMMLFRTVRPVRALRKPEPDDTLREVVYSSRNSWLEEDLHAALHGGAISLDPGELAGREIPIAAAGTYPRDGQEARIVVVGDRDFAANRNLEALYNRDLLLNMVHWLVEREERITIRDKAWTPRQDPITLQETLSFFYFFAFALPEVLLLLGIHAWARQRS